MQDVSNSASRTYTWNARPVLPGSLEKCDFYEFDLVVLGGSCQETRYVQENSAPGGMVPELGDVLATGTDLRTVSQLRH